jgi:hypothetical protein
MSHHFDTQIQACTNEDPRVYGSDPWGFKILYRLQWIDRL